MNLKDQLNKVVDKMQAYKPENDKEKVKPWNSSIGNAKMKSVK